jgi:hypothetical protein
MVIREPGIRTFAVTAVIGRLITSWPFGRLDISREFLRVRVRQERQAACRTVTLVTCKRARARRSLMRIDDLGGHFRDTRLELAMRSGRIMDELRVCGYPVEAVDRRFRFRVPWDRRVFAPAAVLICLARTRPRRPGPPRRDPPGLPRAERRYHPEVLAGSVQIAGLASFIHVVPAILVNASRGTGPWQVVGLV